MPSPARRRRTRPLLACQGLAHPRASGGAEFDHGECGVAVPQDGFTVEEVLASGHRAASLEVTDSTGVPLLSRQGL